MIQYRDFRQIPFRPGFFGQGKVSPEESVDFDGVVSQANEWIGRESVRVINVETVWPPEGGLTWVRVWYEASK
jgi:hypothetical protein